MIDIGLLCVWAAELIPLFATLFSLIYGLKHFFKKGKPIFLQTITLAMGCHSLGNIYHICQALTSDVPMEGFTPAYLGGIGFFLFVTTASYGQLDRIVDDNSPAMKPSRYIALIAPICTFLLFIPNILAEDVPPETIFVYGMVWLPAAVAAYFNLKHAIIPDLDFGFIKAIRPYNILALCLSFAELSCLTAWNYFEDLGLAISAIIFAVLCICTIISAKKGAEKWTV